MDMMIIKKVKQFIEDQELISSHDNILVGLSGGVDSVALLLILNCLYKGTQVSLFPIYVHHKIRSTADLDIVFCKKLCHQLELDLQVAYVDVPDKVMTDKISEEEAARILRYDAFERYSKKMRCTKIAVAHHMEDQAETVLHRLIRGSGGLGLSGMSPKNGNIIRPLLELIKVDLINIVEDRSTGFVQDESNSDLKYTRNKIRHELLPLLEENYNENIVVNLSRLSKLMLMDENYMQEEAYKAYKRVLMTVSANRTVLDIKGLKELKEAMVYRVFRLAIMELKGNLKNVEFNHIRRLSGLITSQSGKKVPVTGDITAQKEYNKLILSRGKTCGKTHKESPVFLDRTLITGYIQNANKSFGVKTISIDEYKGLIKYKDSFKKPSNVYTKWFDYDRIETNLVFRTRQAGDRIIINENGDSKLLKKFFTDEKIPGSVRDEIPLLMMGKQVLWIVGYRASSGYNVCDATKTVLEVRLIKEDDDGNN